MNETRQLRKSPVTLSAYGSGKVTNDEIKLRANNSFEYKSNVKGTQKIVIYAGTFIKNEDTLILKFQDNYKDSLWTGKAVIDTIKNEIILISTNTAYNKEMTIAKPNTHN